MEVGLAAMDRDGVLTHWNREAARMLGWTAEEAVGRSPGPHARAIVVDMQAAVEAENNDGSFDHPGGPGARHQAASAAAPNSCENRSSCSWPCSAWRWATIDTRASRSRSGTRTGQRSITTCRCPHPIDDGVPEREREALVSMVAHRHAEHGQTAGGSVLAAVRGSGRGGLMTRAGTARVIEGAVIVLGLHGRLHVDDDRLGRAARDFGRPPPRGPAEHPAASRFQWVSTPSRSIAARPTSMPSSRAASSRASAHGLVCCLLRLRPKRAPPRAGQTIELACPAGYTGFRPNVPRAGARCGRGVPKKLLPQFPAAAYSVGTLKGGDPKV